MVVAKRWRTGVRAVWRQSMRWGIGDVQLYARYRHTVLLQSSAVADARSYRRMAVRLVLRRGALVPNPSGALLRFIARRYGRLRGSLQERVLFW
jgi:hypothetical protein